MQWLVQLTGIAAALSLAATPPPAVTIRATQPGLRTLDEGDGGGNPFASAFIELLARPDLSPGRFSELLTARTRDLSGGFQTPDIPSELASVPIILGRPAPGERRVAMVLVMSDYSFGLQPLRGAGHDARRVRTALERAGFETRLVLDPARSEVGAQLDRFAAASADADVALIYATGHGIEADGIGYLLNRDFPAVLGLYALPVYGIPLARIGESLKARSANLLFYAGCRDNPFG